MAYISDGVIMNDEKLTPCPFCGCVSQKVIGTRIKFPDMEWYWRVECKDCHASVTGFKTEIQAINAWNRRYEQHEVEQDGDITWSFFDLWKQCAQRYAEECIGRLGTD